VKDMRFRSKLAEAVKALSFDEVSLVPSLSPVDPHEVDLRTKFTKRIELSIPLAASPMDTVTEYEMAVAMALLGGIGVVHRNMPVEQQVEIVRKVKETPPVKLSSTYIRSDVAVSYALDFMKNRGLRCIPVVDGGGVLGYAYLHELIVAFRDNPDKPVALFARPGKLFKLSELDEAKREVIRGSMDCAAVVGENLQYVGTLTLSDALEEISPVLDEEGRLVVAAAVSPTGIDRARKLDRYVDAIVSDVAHLHNVKVLKSAAILVKEISADFVAGNIATGQAAIDVLTYVERVDAFRVGLGGGSICTTPQVTGAYVPTLWAVSDVRDALEEQSARIPVIADGGIRSGGDAVKALAAGASSVMVGYLLAGTDEASAPLIAVGGSLYKPYRGMASAGAMKRRYAVDRYSRMPKRVAEGVEGLVPYRGSVYSVVREVVEAIRAGIGYAGCRSIEDLWLKARLLLVKPKQSPHDMLVNG